MLKERSILYTHLFYDDEGALCLVMTIFAQDQRYLIMDRKVMSKRKVKYIQIPKTKKLTS